MRSMFLVLSACTAVANAAECQATEEATLLQLQGMRGKQTKLKLEAKTTGAKGLVKSLTHIAHNLKNMNTDEVNQALAEAAAALATLSPAIQEQVEQLQATVMDAAAAVEACHNSAGIDQRAALWTAAEEQSAASVTCEAELATAVADEASICSAASIEDVQSECACNEATARREDKEELCAALMTAYEFAYCEHNLQCTTYHECHGSETVVYNQIMADVQAEMEPIEDEYVAAQQSTCIMDIIQNAMLTGAAIDFVAIAACSAVDTSALLVVYPDLPGTPEACPAATTGNPVCLTTHLMVDGCLNQNTEVDRAVVDANSGATASVRCCTTDGSSCDSDHVGCQSGKTYDEAVAICEDAGERLCSEAEMIDRLCCGTGCGFDGHQIWVTP